MNQKPKKMQFSKNMLSLDFMTLLSYQVIGVVFYSEREISDKFYSEDLISASGSFTCRKSTTRDPRLYFPSKGSHTQNFYAEKIHRPRPSLIRRTSDPAASMITTGPLGSRNIYRISLDLIYISLTLNRNLWSWQRYTVGHRLGISRRRWINRQRGRVQILFFLIYFLFYSFLFYFFFFLS